MAFKYQVTYKDFYAALKEGRLIGLKCRKCGTYTAPPKITCAECGSLEVETAVLSGEGEIRTFTVIRVAPEGFTAPYVVAMVEMVEGPWLLGNVAGVDFDTDGLDLVGKKVTVSHRLVHGVPYAAGEGVVLSFLLVE